MRKTKFDIFLPKNFIRGFVVVKAKNLLKIAPGYCEMGDNYYLHKKIAIKDCTRTWKENFVTGVLCDGVVLKKMFWYHLYICGIGKKSYQFLLDDNMIGDHLLATNPRINTFRIIFSIKL